MADRQSMSQRFQDYQPSKTTLFWSCAGCVIATMVVGFTWGGWVTGGTAWDTAQNATQQAKAEVAAAVCVEQFMAASDARPQLASLKEIRSSWQQRSFIEDGGWAVIADQAYAGAAALCAEKLRAMEVPAAQEASSNEAGSVTQ